MRAMPEARRFIAADLPYIPTPDDIGYELVDGELVPVTPAGVRHGRLIIGLCELLRPLVEPKYGVILPEVWFKLGLPYDAERTRSPDVAFVDNARREQIRAHMEGVLPFPPDLAIEFFSPTNERKSKDFDQRILDYLDANVRAVWVIYPQARYAVIHYPDNTARIVRGGDSLSGEDIIPGLEIPLRQLWANLDI